MYYKVIAKIENFVKGHSYVVDASSKTEAREIVWDHVAREYPGWKIERVTVSSEWIWDVIL